MPRGHRHLDPTLAAAKSELSGPFEGAVSHSKAADESPGAACNETGLRPCGRRPKAPLIAPQGAPQACEGHEGSLGVALVNEDQGVEDVRVSARDRVGGEGCGLLGSAAFIFWRLICPC